jgi:ABC-2 type transport system permease protein
MIWKALVGNNPENYFMITYVMVNQASLWVTMFLPRGTYIPQKVLDGTIVYEFIRPYSLLFDSFFETLGHIFYNFLFRSIPIYVFGILLLNTQLPSLSNLIPFLISVFLGFLIAFFLNYFIGLWSILFIDYSGVHNFYFFLMNTFGGNYISLEFYPEFLQPLVKWMPFSGTSYIPGSIYLGRISLVYAFTHQIIWVITLFLLALFLTKKIHKYLQIQGG